MNMAGFPQFFKLSQRINFYSVGLSGFFTMSQKIQCLVFILCNSNVSYKKKTHL